MNGQSEFVTRDYLQNTHKWTIIQSLFSQYNKDILYFILYVTAGQFPMFFVDMVGVRAFAGHNISGHLILIRIKHNEYMYVNKI